MNPAIGEVHIGISRMIAKLLDKGVNSSRRAAVPLASSFCFWLPASMLLVLLRCHVP